jgi:hypothetical protein
MITLSTASIALILLAVFLGAIMTLIGVALGALVVFRTKREPHESLFKVGAEKGDAFIRDDYADEVEDTIDARREARGEKKEDPYDPFPPHVKAAHERMVLQLAKDKKEAGAE